LTTVSVPLIFNPTAGRGRAGRHARAIGDILATAGIDVRPIESRALGDVEEQTARLAGEGHRHIVVAGGDGSIHEAVNGILRSGAETELGVVPIGTGNDFAKASSIPLEWEHAAALLADRLQSGAPARTIDVGRCNDRYFANGAGIGFDAQVSTLARDIRLPIGDLVYLIAVFQALIAGVATPRLTISVDDEASGNQSIDGPLTLASFSNGPWVGGMFHIAPGAKNDDGRLDLVIADPVTRRRIIGLLPRILAGTHIGQPDVRTQTIRRATVVADAPVPSHLDGEIQPLATAFDIEVLTGALRLL